VAGGSWVIAVCREGMVRRAGGLNK